MVKPNNNSLKVFPDLISSSSGDAEHTLLTVIYTMLGPAGSQSLALIAVCFVSLYVLKDLCVFLCI